MLLREDVVLGRAGRVPPASRRAHVGVARQGVGGCCLGGHAFLFRVDWRIYLARRASDGWLWWIFYDFAAGAFKVSRDPAPRALMCSLAVKNVAALRQRLLVGMRGR